VLNKVDLLAAGQRESLALTHPDAWLLSAHDAADVETLRTRLQQHFAASDVEGTVVVPFRHGEWVAELHRGARVLKQHPTSRGTRLHVRAPREVWSRVDARTKAKPPCALSLAVLARLAISKEVGPTCPLLL
jgi:GTP-binding protein HflX